MTHADLLRLILSLPPQALAQIGQAIDDAKAELAINTPQVDGQIEIPGHVSDIGSVGWRYMNH